MTEQELDRIKIFCEGFIFAALQSCELHFEYQTKVIMNNKGVESIELTRLEHRQNDEPLVPVGDLIKLYKFIEKSFYIELNEKQLLLDTSSGKLVIK